MKTRTKNANEIRTSSKRTGSLAQAPSLLYRSVLKQKEKNISQTVFFKIPFFSKKKNTGSSKTKCAAVHGSSPTRRPRHFCIKTVYCPWFGHTRPKSRATKCIGLITQRDSQQWSQFFQPPTTAMCINFVFLTKWGKFFTIFTVSVPSSQILGPVRESQHIILRLNV